MKQEINFGIIKMTLNLKIYSAIFIIGILVFSFYSNNSIRQNKMINKSEIIIKEIEKYKQEYGTLPESLSDLGFNEEDGYNSIYYFKRDRCNFTISFPISEEQHLFYYSDTKKWEKGYRKMVYCPPEHRT